ncbi:MAG: class I SAM-dependent methyltransferase [Phaeodactylibacter sp.]|uniref:class I SAM-dependent methyltransferase n=1 Tax=Phaeodactylibacter sp. TaxID=1940289 RepID=UPI0032ED931F
MYGKFWDAFYQKTYAAGKALWDVPPEQSVLIDHQRFGPVFTVVDTVLDIGCGTGEQSRYLAGLYSTVIGIDAAPRAIEIANQFANPPNVTFRAGDLANPELVQDLHETHGDLNVYMRGVLHQIRTADRQRVAKHLLQLIGEKGALYLIEVGKGIKDYFKSASPAFHELPAAVQETFISNLPPHGVDEAELEALFQQNGYQLLQRGTGFLNTNLLLKDGTPVKIPAVFGLIVKN